MQYGDDEGRGRRGERKRKESSPRTDIRIACRDSLAHIANESFSGRPPPPPLRLLASGLAETERTAAAAAETSTLLGCRSCGTGLRELPLEELHSPYVLPRLHVTHIYLRLCASSTRTGRRAHRLACTLHTQDACAHAPQHAYTHLRRYPSSVMSCTVCAPIYAVAGFQFPAWDGSRFPLFARLVSGTGSRYDDARHSIYSDVRSSSWDRPPSS